MNSTTTASRHSSVLARLVTVAVVAIVAVAGWATSNAWLPPVREQIAALLAGDPPAEEADDHGHAHDAGEDPDVLTVSPEALQTLAIETGILRRDTYRRVARFPGRAVVIPGIGRQEATAPSSGQITRIYVEEGASVRPSQPLFDLELIHDEGIKVQIELLDALAEKEVINAELARLEDLQKRTPGAVLGTRLLEKRYKRWHLNHVIASRRQMLILLGLPENDVDQLIEDHKQEGPDALKVDVAHYREEPLLKKITVFAPGVSTAGEDKGLFVLEELKVVKGQHVDTGDTLCLLGDYGRLYIAGEAFERDLPMLRRVMDRQWEINAAIERRGEEPLLIEGLQLAYLAPRIDVESRSAPFFVALENQLRTLRQPADMTDEGAARLDWTFRPGHRMELRVPVSQVEDVLIVPVEAVAEDGLDHFVFQVSGNTFVRKPVRVVEHDEDYIVLEETRTLTQGVKIALSGAYQLQLALLNRAAGPAAAHHGHTH